MTLGAGMYIFKQLPICETFYQERSIVILLVPSSEF